MPLPARRLASPPWRVRFPSASALLWRTRHARSLSPPRHSRPTPGGFDPRPPPLCFGAPATLDASPRQATSVATLADSIPVRLRFGFNGRRDMGSLLVHVTHGPEAPTRAAL